MVLDFSHLFCHLVLYHQCVLPLVLPAALLAYLPTAIEAQQVDRPQMLGPRDGPLVRPYTALQSPDQSLGFKRSESWSLA